MFMICLPLGFAMTSVRVPTDTRASDGRRPTPRAAAAEARADPQYREAGGPKSAKSSRPEIHQTEPTGTPNQNRRDRKGTPSPMSCKNLQSGFGSIEVQILVFL